MTTVRNTHLTPVPATVAGRNTYAVGEDGSTELRGGELGVCVVHAGVQPLQGGEGGVGGLLDEDMSCKRHTNNAGKINLKQFEPSLTDH